MKNFTKWLNSNVGLHITHCVLCVALCLSVGTVNSQNVDRQHVLLEKFTGTWCSPCAGAEVEIHRAISEGCDFAVVEYHERDVFANDLAAKRTEYYGNKSFPGFVFDGESVKSSDGYYEMAVKYYNECKAVSSPLFIDVKRTMGATVSDWTFDVKVNRVNSEFNDVADLRLFATVVESKIRYSWYLSSIDYLGRTSLTSLDGESVTFKDNVYEKQLAVNLDKDIQVGNCEMVFFVQNIKTKEVVQAYKMKFVDEQIITQVPTITKTEQLAGTQSIKVDWSMPTAKSAILLGYNVYNKNDKKLNTESLITDNYFISRRQDISSEQCFYVTAVYDLVEGENSNKECATVILLTEPTSFDTINRGNASNEIRFSWEVPTGYGSGSGKESNILGYNIYRNSEKINAAPIKSTDYKDIVGQIGKYYYYATAVYGNELVKETVESPKTTQILVEVKRIDHVSVQDHEIQSLVIYPNPVKEVLHISGRYTSLEIYDTAGKVLINANGESQIDVSPLPKGVYVIKAYDDYRVKTYKIVK